ncbi:tetratricopeptide repeat protein [Streptomyces sp. 142MFCol3.1]|uniref:tetratricopeptide repeat protein n=1 Tax=Streptomyces sp. 142MFCol3.1 TaxID=1172179 RepID=UPI000420DDA2|nr:tetratricopeptide repeat protein [Streptomyces sp. 142MFCol3.1]
MSPRTNESAPESERGEPSVAAPETDAVPETDGVPEPSVAAPETDAVPETDGVPVTSAGAARAARAAGAARADESTPAAVSAGDGEGLAGAGQDLVGAGQDVETADGGHAEGGTGAGHTEDGTDGAHAEGGAGDGHAGRAACAGHAEGSAGAGHGGDPAGGEDDAAGGVPVEGTASGARRQGSAHDDERVAAVRRLSVSGRRRRAAQLAFCSGALAVAMTAGAIVLGAARDSGGRTVATVPRAVSPQLLAGGDLDTSISSLQAHLKTQPKDFGGWATLGLAYVEQARTKGDPSRYPQAQKALDRSLRLRPDNDPALAGRAALAAARHDFTGALKYADKALKQNPYSERALSSRIDALVELGRYDDASKAADLADKRRPGVPVFTRYAYVHELRGDTRTARRVLRQALDSATTRGDVSYVATALGQLAWSQGDYDSALTYYARALSADDSYLPALEGRARAQAAQGDEAAAIRGMEQVVERYPLPQPLVELGELYEARGAAGDARKAHDQYSLVKAWVSLARANGVDADLDTALAAADHGDHAAALKAARAEWARRHTVHTADAMAWALHVDGRDAQALPYAREATATGYRNASFLYHRGMIERATGHEKEARASLKAALGLNPGFSPLGAREARTALEAAK